MEEENIIQVPFGPEEDQLYKMFRQYCEKKGARTADYIKEMIKRELSWGQFARRGKKQDG